MLASLRSAFLAGIVVLSPIAVTIYVFNILVTAIGGGFRNYFFFFVPEDWLGRPDLQTLWNFLATVMVLLIITALGFASRYLLGKVMLSLTERIIDRLPFINTIYNSVKQIVQTFSTQQKAIFQKCVMLEYPRKGVWVLGFLTSRSRGEPQARTSSELCNVFIPTTPNPTSGFLLMVPVNEVIELTMTVGEGMKLIISGGAVVPVFGEDGKGIEGARVVSPGGKARRESIAPQK